MSNQLKSLFVKRFKEQINILNNLYKFKSNNDFKFSTNKHSDLKVWLKNEKENRSYHEHKNLKELLEFNFISLYELRDSHLSFCFDFPKEFESIEELESKTIIYISEISLYGYESQNTHASYRFINFKQFISDYKYIMGLYNKYGLFENNNESPVVAKSELFKNLLKDGSKTLEFIKRIKKDEGFYIRMLDDKKSYIEKRRAYNKRRKESKKGNKSENKNIIQSNIDKIKSMEREIQRLNELNKQLKSFGEPKNEILNGLKRDAFNAEADFINKYERECYIRTNQEEDLNFYNIILSIFKI